jgi:hypothetical protein
MKRLFYFLFLAITVISCEKGKANFVLKGTIQDETFSTTLAGATIQLYQVQVGSASETFVSSQTIGSDGTYSFSFPRDNMEKYILRIEKDNYFALEKTVYFSSLTLNSDNIRDYSTTAKAWVKLNFINDPNFGGNQLEYTIQQGKENVDGSCQHGTYTINTSTSYYCINDGNQLYSYLYFAFGPNDTGVKSIITTPFDTTELTLTY